jgi:hypothetical protein
MKFVFKFFKVGICNIEYLELLILKFLLFGGFFAHFDLTV